jgi:ADP-ribose pyrophosphatase YjhB (NUDIX family)
MGKAARAIIVEDDKILVMNRDKYGNQYTTLPGGRLQPGEEPEVALKREVYEETGLEITASQLVFTEDNPEPYNFQYIYLCQVASHQAVAIQADSEEAVLNKLGLNIHTPEWVEISAFHTLSFMTPDLQQAILEALKNGFPAEPKAI